MIWTIACTLWICVITSEIKALGISEQSQLVYGGAAIVVTIFSILQETGVI